MNQYDQYHRNFNRLAMSFALFEKKFGVSMPILSAVSEKAVRGRYNHLSSMRRRPQLAKMIAAQEQLDNTAKYPVLKSKSQVLNYQDLNCKHGNSELECSHCAAAAEPQTQSFDADPSADAAELFASASASHARLDKKTVQEPMSFAGVLQAWAAGKTTEDRLSRAFLRKRPPLSVQKDDPQSIQNFVESISFPVEAALSGKGHFFDGKSVPDDMKVRVNRQMVALKSTVASDYIMGRQMSGKTVFL
jgi:hypothetical protein